MTVKQLIEQLNKYPQDMDELSPKEKRSSVTGW